MATKPSLYVIVIGLALLVAGVLLYVTGNDSPGALLVGAAIGVLTGNVAPSGEAFAPAAPPLVPDPNGPHGIAPVPPVELPPTGS